jgi:hypothetical protein
MGGFHVCPSAKVVAPCACQGITNYAPTKQSGDSASGRARSLYPPSRPLQKSAIPRSFLPNLFQSSIWKTAVLLGILIASSRIAPAQALESGQRGTEIAPFAQYTLLSPDWGPTRDVGFAGGVDYTRFIRSIPVRSHIDLRVDFSRQQWNIDPQTLTPTTLGVGIAYRIPFHNGREE